MTEEKLKLELERAYRCIRGLYGVIANGRAAPSTMLAYHGPTIGAAIRYVDEGALDGAEYFVGKKIEVLHAALEKARGSHAPPARDPGGRDPRNPGGTHC